MANHTSLMRCIAGAAAVLFLVLHGAPLHGMGQRGQKPTEQERAVPAPAPSARPESRTAIRDILSDPVKFSDAEVVLEGVFRGWKGACPASSMLTRSDWVIEDQTGCIYVTGLVPHDLSLMQPRDERIVVTGRVIVGKMGKPVIKAQKLTQVEKK